MGEMLVLKGEKYILHLDGRKRSEPRWVGSEYCTAKHDFYWYEGAGAITDPSNKKIYFFTFTTWHGECQAERTLRGFIFSSDSVDWQLGRCVELCVVEHMQRPLIDSICERVLTEVSKSERVIPAVSFGRLERKSLVHKGFVPDESGQLMLPF